jgi:hypothetical protein
MQRQSSRWKRIDNPPISATLSVRPHQLLIAAVLTVIGRRALLCREDDKRIVIGLDASKDENHSRQSHAYISRESSANRGPVTLARRLPLRSTRCAAAI